ncbi:transglycosylase domain-containing protein, partial [Myxococcota bacterium]|nr:transglycosylase domain-containing protein [Myxococcota bacterium]MBU1536120.1 transglycosylase domain-containing protein [Myxococcota bacterium]
MCPLLSDLKARAPGLWKKPWLRRLLWVLAVPLLGLAAFLLYVRLGSYPLERLEYRGSPSLRISDRHGVLLREFSGDASRFHRWIPLSEISGTTRAVFLFSEDRAFYSHGGVNHLSLLRAMFKNLWARSVVSGASTVTMQLARMVYPRPRTLTSKFKEMVEAYRMERALSKEEILEQYLNRLPFY